MKTLSDLPAFAHDSLTGRRIPTTIPKGTEVRNVRPEAYDPIYGEPIAWFEADYGPNGWAVFGAINLPVLKKGWARAYFSDEPTIQWP